MLYYNLATTFLAKPMLKINATPYSRVQKYSNCHRKWGKHARMSGNSLQHDLEELSLFYIAHLGEQRSTYIHAYSSSIHGAQNRSKTKLLVNAVTNGTVSGPRTRTTLESLDIFNDPNSITKVDLYSGAYAVLVHVTRSVASARTQKRQH